MINMNFTDIIIGISGLLYLSVSVVNGFKGEWPWCFLWLCYSMANFALVAIAMNKV